MVGTLPSNFNTAVVTALFLSFDEQPVQGTVTFTPSIRSMVSPSAEAIILGKVITGKVVDGELLNAAGNGPLRLFATDDPDVSLQGWTYSVKEELSGGAGRPEYPISVPVSASDYGLDLWNLAPAQVIGVPVEPAATVTALTALSSRVAALENGGPVRAVVVPLGGPLPARPQGATMVYWFSNVDPGPNALAERDIWIPITA